MSEVTIEPKIINGEFQEGQEALDHASLLRELFTVSDEVVEECRPKLWSTAEKVAAMLVNPEQQQALATYANMIDWQIFGRPYDELPDGLVLISDEDDDLCVATDPTNPYLNYELGFVDEALFEAGLSEAIRPAIDELNERQEEIEAVVKDCIINSDAYKLLASFDETQTKPETQPLNTYWRQVREQQIAEKIRHRFGINSGESIPPDSPFHQEFRREAYYLDNETMPQSQTVDGADKALQRARNYLIPYVAEDFNKTQSGRSEFVEVEYCEDDGLYIRSSTDEKGQASYELWDYARDTGYTLGQKLSAEDDETRMIAYKFLGVAIETILDPRNTSTYKEILDSVVESAVSYAVDTFRQVSTVRSMSLISTFDDGESVVLRKPQASAVDNKWHSEVNRSTPKYNWRDAFNTDYELSTREEILSNERLTTGWVNKYGPANFRTDGRLILSQRRQEPLGSQTGEDDLTIEFTFGYNRSNIPFIPGYKLTSESPFQNRYGFKVDPEGDPYRPCPVIINQKRRKSLADTYSGMGLHTLSGQILSKSKLTVAELGQLIKDSSVYHVPDQLFRYDRENPLQSNQSYNMNFDSFAKVVDNDKLLTQCTGASSFLKLSLESVFGRSCASIVSGNVLLANDARIDGRLHAQTIFTHKGRQYIIDTTPPGTITGELPPTPIDQGFDYSRQRHTAHAPHLAMANKDEVPVTHEAYVEKTLEEKVIGLRSGLTERLKVAFDLPTDDKLYDHLVQLPGHDPARRAFELLVQFEDGRIAADEVTDKVSYVENCAEASPDIRRKLKFDHYTTEFLEELRSTSWRLASAIQYEADKESTNE